MTALHLRGPVLPEGEHRDVYVVEGRITYEPVGAAQTVAEGWLVPGLVDAHCHVGLGPLGAVERHEEERQAVANRDAGALLLRDCGSPVDNRWVQDRDDLPRLIRAGRHLGRPKRYIRGLALEVEPSALPDAVAEQATRADGWVKLVGDWIDRDTGDLAPCWPADTLREAVVRAHGAGARVTVHVFGEDALPDLVAAGVDCVEHGTGLPDAVLPEMAARQVALVPTLINIETFPDIAAGAGRFPTYAAHMLRLHGGVAERVRAAYEAGVPIYAGTDAGGGIAHGRIADEVQALAAAGLSAADALGAASWRARAWLGRPDGLSEGAPADLVVYPANPLEDLAVLAHPTRVVLRGRVVR